jgi:hypothetical protein
MGVFAHLHVQVENGCGERYGSIVVAFDGEDESALVRLRRLKDHLISDIAAGHDGVRLPPAVFPAEIVNVREDE